MNGKRATSSECAGYATPGKLGGDPQTLTVRSFKLHKICQLFRKKRGAAAVELALVAPLFFLILFGLIEFGRCIMVQQLLTNASREGARRAVLDGTTTSDVQQTVSDFLTNAHISGATTTVTPDPPSSAGSGAPVSVTVAVDFRDVSWLPVPRYLGAATLSATSVMRRESVE